MLSPRFLERSQKKTKFQPDNLISANSSLTVLMQSVYINGKIKNKLISRSDGNRRDITFS